MRIDKRWTTLEYCWRFGLRPLMWLVRLAVIAAAVALLSLLTPVLSHEGMLAFIGIYAVWEIGRAVRSIKPLNINVTRGEKLIVQRGASISVPKEDIDRLIEFIARQENATRKAAETQAQSTA